MQITNLYGYYVNEKFYDSVKIAHSRFKILISSCKFHIYINNCFVNFNMKYCIMYLDLNTLYEEEIGIDEI